MQLNKRCKNLSQISAKIFFKSALWIGIENVNIRTVSVNAPSSSVSERKVLVVETCLLSNVSRIDGLMHSTVFLLEKGEEF